MVLDRNLPRTANIKEDISFEIILSSSDNAANGVAAVEADEIPPVLLLSLEFLELLHTR